MYNKGVGSFESWSINGLYDGAIPVDWAYIAVASFKSEGLWRYDISKSFIKDANEQFYYLRSVATPLEIIFSKIIYNALLITVLSLVIYAVMVLFFNENIIWYWSS